MVLGNGAHHPHENGQVDASQIPKFVTVQATSFRPLQRNIKRGLKMMKEGASTRVYGWTLDPLLHCLSKLYHAEEAKCLQKSVMIRHQLHRRAWIKGNTGWFFNAQFLK